MPHNISTTVDAPLAATHAVVIGQIHNADAFGNEPLKYSAKKHLGQNQIEKNFCKTGIASILTYYPGLRLQDYPNHPQMTTSRWNHNESCSRPRRILCLPSSYLLELPFLLSRHLYFFIFFDFLIILVLLLSDFKMASLQDAISTIHSSHSLICTYHSNNVQLENYPNLDILSLNFSNFDLNFLMSPFSSVLVSSSICSSSSSMALYSSLNSLSFLP